MKTLGHLLAIFVFYLMHVAILTLAGMMMGLPFDVIQYAGFVLAMALFGLWLTGIIRDATEPDDEEDEDKPLKVELTCITEEVKRP